jgi:hypothetical protein
MKARNTESCRPVFRLLNTRPFYSQYIFSISMFVVKNKDTFILNSDIHSIHTRQGLALHHPTCKLTKVQKGVYYSGITIFNNLPQNFKNMTNDVNKLKHALKSFSILAPFTHCRSIQIGE